MSTEDVGGNAEGAGDQAREALLEEVDKTVRPATLKARAAVGKAFDDWRRRRPLSSKLVREWLLEDVKGHAASSAFTRRSHLLAYLRRSHNYEISETELSDVSELCSKEKKFTAQEKRKY